jgi:hypothetical protein
MIYIPLPYTIMLNVRACVCLSISVLIFIKLKYILNIVNPSMNWLNSPFHFNIILGS